MNGTEHGPGNRLKEIRESKDPKVELYDIAAFLRVSVDTVRRWDGGALIPTKYIESLTERLEVSADHLLGLDRSESSKTGSAAA
jgi:DNA-binding transcriptional regulator YiaG